MAYLRSLTEMFEVLMREMFSVLMKELDYILEGTYVMMFIYHLYNYYIHLRMVLSSFQSYCSWFYVFRCSLDYYYLSSSSWS